MFFPSSETKEELMCRVYEEANIDPLKVNYFEAYSTGTKVGDPQEAKAIFNAYCAKPKRGNTSNWSLEEQHWSRRRCVRRVLRDQSAVGLRKRVHSSMSAPQQYQGQYQRVLSTIRPRKGKFQIHSRYRWCEQLRCRWSERSRIA